MKKQMDIQFSYSISPADAIDYNFNALMGKSNENLIKNLLKNKAGKKIGKMIYINISELMNNAIENSRKKDSNIEIGVTINYEYFEIKVKNSADEKKFLLLKEHIKKIKQYSDPRQMLAITLNKNRINKKKSGIGLIRLASENKAILSVSYNKKNSYVTVKSKVRI